jgi:hypothetical protein
MDGLFIVGKCLKCVQILEIFDNPVFWSRTAYMGISTFLRCVHVECQFPATNRLHQFLKRRRVRASPGSLARWLVPRDARTLRRLRNWLRN